MRTIIISTVSVLALAACSPKVQQICTDEYINKVEGSVQTCIDVAVEWPVSTPAAWVDDKEPRDPRTPTPPVDEPPVDEPPVDEPPVDEPPVDDPKKPKGDNSDANCKGGNDHDRDDFDSDSQENAENKCD